MPATHRLNIPRAKRRWVMACLVGCLVLVLPLHGWWGVMVHLLGARHVHDQAASVTVGQADAATAALMRQWRYFGRVDGAMPVMATELASPLGAGHQHDDNQPARHHHAIDDTSVVTLDASLPGDADGADGASASAGSLMQLFAPQQATAIRLPAMASLAWPEFLSQRISSWSPQRVKRPPKLA